MKFRAFLKRVVLVSAALLVAACEPAPGPGAVVDVSRAVKVGLLVPLGSGNAQTEQLAVSLVNAAKLAQGDLAGTEIELMVFATTGTGEGAAAAAARAIAGGAEILVGPLFSVEVAAVAPLARHAAIPVFAFSNNSAVAGSGTYVLGVTYESVAARLVDFAAARGLRNFAVVHPDGVDGAAGRDSVAAAVKDSGAILAVAASYPSSFDGIGAKIPGIAAQIRAAGANAIVFTDTPTGGLGFAAAGLRGAGLGASAYQFMGLTRWDASADILAQPSLAGGWYCLPDPGLNQQFSARYQSAYGMPPHDLSGIAYDAIAAVGALLSEARKSSDRVPFAVGKITDPAGFVGVNGIFRLLQDGTNQRGLAIMQVTGGVGIVVDPAPRTFGGAGS